MVFFMRLRHTKVCLHTLKKEFELRIGVKSEGTHQSSAAGIFRKTGQTLEQNW